MQILINNGAILNYPDSSGELPIHIASREGALDAAKCLIDKDAFVNYANWEGQTPLMLAAINGSIDVQ